MIKILIIDDSPSDRLLYSKYLARAEKYDFDIVEAKTGKQGLEMLKSTENISCILLDFKLPDCTGLDILSKIKKNYKIPVIFVTGKPEPLTMTHAYKEGALIYLSKDYLGSESLIEAIDKALNFNKRN